MPKPIFLVLAVVTCVGAGAVFNKCLTCTTPANNVNFSTQVQGVPFDPSTPSAAAEVSQAPTLPPLPLPKKEAGARDGKVLAMSFDTLASYEYKFPEIGEDNPADQIPARIMKLTGKDIAVQGFMIPIKNEGENVVEFVLVRNQFACCFGVVPKMNEWLHVKMVEGKTAPYALDIPITVYGKLEVGELWENGVVMSLYRLACTDVEEPPTFR